MHPRNKSMIQFPPCKINLGLSIIAKRADGYHELESVFYPVQLKDMVEVCIAENTNELVQFSHSGIPVPGEAENNLCIKAYQLLKIDFRKFLQHKFIYTNIFLWEPVWAAAPAMLLLF